MGAKWPAWRAKGSFHSQPPMQCSPPDAPTISSAWRSPKSVCRARSCALPGLTTGYGPSHQATEDLAICGMPNSTVIDPCDALDVEQAVPAIVAHDGPVYLRLLRGGVPIGLDEYDYKFDIGMAKFLRDGADVLVISSGLMTMRALEAAKHLEADRIGVAVLHCPTISCLMRRQFSRPAQRRDAWSSLPRIIPSTAARRSDRRVADAVRRASGVQADRPARRVPRCRRAADVARPLRTSSGEVAKVIREWV